MDTPASTPPLTTLSSSCSSAGRLSEPCAFHPWSGKAFIYLVNPEVKWVGRKISRQPRSLRHMVPTPVSPWERQSRWKAEMKWRSKVNSVIRFLIKDKTLITSKALRTTLNVSWTFRVHVSINCTCHGDTCISQWWSWGMLGGVYPRGCAAGHLPSPGRQSCSLQPSSGTLNPSHVHA